MIRIPRWLNLKTVTIVAVLYVFLVPVVPTTVSAQLLLPQRNECVGGIASPSSRQVVASISYIAVGLALSRTTHEGSFGLVYVPNNGWYTVQFPPIGFENIGCL